jgi:hypothetical protein|eukprot:COSAG01_NODE_9225_length_2513_cov_9.411350_2_plen_53_part_00
MMSRSRYFDARRDSHDPDYVGTLQQLDDTMGELVDVLQRCTPDINGTTIASD